MFPGVSLVIDVEQGVPGQPPGRGGIDGYLAQRRGKSGGTAQGNAVQGYAVIG